MFKFLTKFLNSNEKEIKKLFPLVEKVNSYEPMAQKLKETDFPKKTQELQNRFADGESLEQLLPQAFALVREASFRVNKERHFDVQVMGAIVLHQGKIAEQKTGEGKTLTASMPLYLNSLAGKGAHLVTVNDYLAKVGVGWMGPIFNLLGVSCAAIVHDASFIFDHNYVDEKATDWRLRHLRPVSRKEAYGAGITYGINSEFGFDYLRDNMVREKEQIVQREFNFAIVDEVDSVLIDEARTPHIISAPDNQPVQMYYQFASIAQKLTNKLDYVVDEKMRTAHLTEHGTLKVEQMFGVKNIYETDFSAVHHIEAALKAKVLFQKEKDYIVRENEVMIVDEFTGRLMPGRRWSEGIHQAIEAKENVPIQQESKTLATISLQNYFRKYTKLSGMTGTAITESEEFHKIYKLDVVTIPTQRPLQRMDQSDQIYKTQRAKYAALVHDIEDAHRTGRPVLVGTTSIEKNEIVTQFLKHKGIPHQVLNAKQHEREAMIISQAGKKGAVTVATNMAGRGVDIILGGNTPKYDDGRPMVDTPEWKKWQKDHDEVVSVGGLHVIGTERHESRRIDNQLRGRAGRQGDPGSSRFFLSLDDDIMRIFGGEQVAKLMTFFNIPEDQVLEHSIVNRSIEQAQSKVEQFNFDSRKATLEYDDVMSQQREIIYSRRREMLKETEGDKEKTTEQYSVQKEKIMSKIDNEIQVLVNLSATTLDAQEQSSKIIDDLSTIIPFDENSKKELAKTISAKIDLLEKTEFLQKIARDLYSQRENEIGVDVMRFIEKQEGLRVLDTLWMEHLEAMDDLRSAIGLRRHAQRDPLVEYKSEAFEMFERLMANIDADLVRRLYKINVVVNPTMQPTTNTNASAIENIGNVKTKTSVIESQNIKSSPTIEKSKPGRNDPCWCGSGKKWKKCHYPK